MPLNFQQPVVGLFLLLLAVPVQYLLSQHWTPVPRNLEARDQALSQLIDHACNFTDQLLSLDTWQQWYNTFLESLLALQFGNGIKHPGPDENDEVNTLESVAKEIFDVLDPNGQGHFALSSRIRSPRSKKVTLHVGQVINHKVWGYRGVIVGWDEVCRAPEEWISQHFPKDRRKAWIEQPNYRILVDTRDRTLPQFVYVPQENLQLAPTGTSIMHPQMDNFFTLFDKALYIPRSWLQRLYPDE